MEEIGELSSTEITEWQASRELDPWIAERLDAAAGLIAWSNLAVWQGKDSKPMQPEDFIKDWDGSRAERKKMKAEEEWQAWIKRVREDSSDVG